jgi:hypothetical protein
MATQLMSYDFSNNWTAWLRDVTYANDGSFFSGRRSNWPRQYDGGAAFTDLFKTCTAEIKRRPTDRHIAESWRGLPGE